MSLKFGTNIRSGTEVIVRSSGAYCKKTFTREKTKVKSENSGSHKFTIDFTIGKKTGG